MLIVETGPVTERLRVRRIDDDEGRRLVRIIRRGAGSVVTWRRAQMVLLSAQGMDVPAIAKVAFTSEDRVRDVIRNFNADGFSSLYPRYKGSRPPFETGLWLTPRVDRFAQVMVRNNRYSVPVRLIGRRVRVLRTPRTWSSTTGARKLPGTSGCPASPAAAWTWTTTWRHWSASPARCPGRPRWSRPAQAGSSPPSTMRGGRRSAKPTGTPQAPAP